MSPESKDQAGEEEYQVLAVGQGRKAAGVVSVRLGPEEMDILMRVADSGGHTLSETLRLGLHCLSRQLEASPARTTFVMRSQLSRSYTEAGALRRETNWLARQVTYGASVG